MNTEAMLVLQKLKTALEHSETVAPKSIKNELVKEISVVNRLYKELVWQNLSDTQKQENRLSMFDSHKINSTDREASAERMHQQYVIELYDLISSTLAFLQNNNQDADIYLLRLEAMLFVEKELINESQLIKDLRHNDYYIMINLLQEGLDKNYTLLTIFDLKTTYINMYRTWPKRPWKEIV